MKFIYFDSATTEEIINGRLYQSTEYSASNTLISFLRGSLSHLRLSGTCVALKYGEGGFVVSPSSKKEDYLVIDLEEAGDILSLDDAGLLLVVQKTLRFCVKMWSGLAPSKHEHVLSQGKAAIFPYPIGFQTSLRVSIDRQPDEKRRAKRESGHAYLVYKFGSSGGAGPSETPRLTNFRKAVEAKLGAYSDATRYLEESSRDANGAASSLAVTSLVEQQQTRSESGIENWRRVLTNSQVGFIDNPLTVPHRIEGPAGTGKTLCLVLKAINLLNEKLAQRESHRSIFVTHSQATKTAIENLFAANDGERFLASDVDLLNSEQSIAITTLHELCAKLLRREISEVELIDRDAYESKLTQKLYAIEAVERTMTDEFASHRPFLSSEFAEFLETSDRWAVAEMLQHEISVQIKGRAEQDLTKYKDLPSLKFGLPVQVAGDRAFVFLMYEEYQRELVAAAQFDTDDVVLSAISQLSTPIWRRRRSREGFDSIFIDETHLFNLNELSIFHQLTKNETEQPIAYSVDRSQALGDRGWTTEAFEGAFEPDGIAGNTKATNVKSVFRCSPEIIDLAFSVTSSGANLFTNFHNPLTAAASAFSAEEERKCKKPTYFFFPADDVMYQEAFAHADNMAREMGCQKADIAIIAFGDEVFREMQSLALSLRKPTETIKSRGDLGAVQRARQGGKFVLTAPEFVGGLEFAGVVLVGVDAGRVPPRSSGAGESQAFLNYAAHQKLYVAITRAKYRVDVLGVKARGLSDALASARTHELLDMSEAA